ncbi:MAG: ATP cone domain-containing protein, partial [Methylococcales bacterium]
MTTESTVIELGSPRFIASGKIPSAEIHAVAPGEVRVIRRNGKVTAFDSNKIKVAITKAFLAVEGGNAAASSRIHDTVMDLCAQIARALTRRMPGGGTVHIEDIQDQVELALMRTSHHKVARAYVLYREEHNRLRAEKLAAKAEQGSTVLHVSLEDGSRIPLDTERLLKIIEEACVGLPEVDSRLILEESMRSLFDGVPEKDVGPSLVMSARTRIEKEPSYSYVTARLLLDGIRSEALTFLYGSRTSASQ